MEFFVDEPRFLRKRFYGNQATEVCSLPPRAWAKRSTGNMPVLGASPKKEVVLVEGGEGVAPAADGAAPAAAAAPAATDGKAATPSGSPKPSKAKSDKSDKSQKSAAGSASASAAEEEENNQSKAAKLFTCQKPQINGGQHFNNEVMVHFEREQQRIHKGKDLDFLIANMTTNFE